MIILMALLTLINVVIFAKFLCLSFAALKNDDYSKFDYLWVGGIGIALGLIVKSVLT